MRRNKNIISLLLITLFVWYYAGTTMCYHTHIVNGVKIVHSHPFPNSTHSHSTASYQIISHFAHIMIFAIVFALLAKIFRKTFIILGTKIECYHDTFNVSLISLRAPPYFIFYPRILLS